MKRCIGRWKNTGIVLTFILVLFAWTCGMADNIVFQPTPLDGMQEVLPSKDTEKLDAETVAFLRGHFTIQSAHYYQASGKVPWIAISKSIQNQMKEKSIQQVMFEWYEPGVDFIEIYPQGDSGAAFAVAMPRQSDLNGDKLIGFYVLSAPAIAP